MSEHTLTILRCNGLVVQGSPLDPQPLKVQLFGKPDAPIQRELIDVREVDALLSALRPAVEVMLAYSAGTDSERVEAARKTLGGVWAPDGVERPALNEPMKQRLVLQ